jgi:hypothetical protein
MSKANKGQTTGGSGESFRWEKFLGGNRAPQDFSTTVRNARSPARWIQLLLTAG